MPLMSKTCKNYDFCTKLKEGIDASKFHPPQGYNPLEVIRNASIWWVPAPFHTTYLWVKLRCLNAMQISAISKMSIIDARTEEEKKDFKATRKIVIDIANDQEAITKAALIYPTFEEIVKATMDIDIIEKRKELEELKKELEKIDKKDKRYKEFDKKIYEKELFLAFPLPTNFMSFIYSWVRGIDITNAKLLSREHLLSAAIKAINGHDNPHDHVHGIFSDKDETEIDDAAWFVYGQYQEDKKTEQRLKKNNYKWIGKKPR